MELRAVITKSLLEHLRTHRPRLAEAVGREIDGEALEQIETSLGISMIPLELHLDVLDVLAGEIGAEELQVVFSELFREYFSEMPAIGSFLDATLRMFAPTPPNLARAVPRSWRSLTRDAGEFSAPIIIDEGSFEQVFSDYDAKLGERPNWAWTLAGTLDGIIERVGCVGHTEIEGDPRTGRVTFRVHWRGSDLATAPAEG